MRDDALQWMSKAACINKEELFFPERYNNEAIRAARSYCAQCPVFEACVAWASPRFLEIPVGIWFGYTEIERKAQWLGTMRFTDWRKTGWTKGITKRTLSSREREARKHGVAAVCDLYTMYDTADPDRRAQIIDTYRHWVEDQNFPTTYTEASARAERLAVAEATQRRLPPKLRPPCPSGCPPEKMYRLRTNAAGEILWCCYQCRAKVVGPAMAVVR